MGKILLFLFGIPILISALAYFWITVKRKWNKEDRLNLQQERKQALLEFKNSEEDFEEFMRINYSKESVPSYIEGGLVK